MNRIASILVLAFIVYVSLCGCKSRYVPPTSVTIAQPQREGDKLVNPQDGAELALVPAGEFQMGMSDEQFKEWLKAHPDDNPGWFVGEYPQHPVYLDAYYMYKTEVTVAQYQKFCNATGYQMPPKPMWKLKDNDPIVRVSWYDAKAYADWAGATLPSEAQWEKAARGGDGRMFTWGDSWPPPKGAGNLSDETRKKVGIYVSQIIDGYDDGYAETSPVATYAANPYGIYDLTGNVEEWCSDWYDTGYNLIVSPKNPTGPDKGAMRVLRGSTFGSNIPSSILITRRGRVEPDARDSMLGFRCVIDVKP